MGPAELLHVEEIMGTNGHLLLQSCGGKADITRMYISGIHAGEAIRGGDGFTR